METPKHSVSIFAEGTVEVEEPLADDARFELWEYHTDDLLPAARPARGRAPKVTSERKAGRRKGAHSVPNAEDTSVEVESETSDEMITNVVAETSDVSSDMSTETPEMAVSGVPKDLQVGSVLDPLEKKDDQDHSAALVQPEAVESAVDHEVSPRGMANASKSRKSKAKKKTSTSPATETLESGVSPSEDPGETPTKDAHRFWRQSPPGLSNFSDLASAPSPSEESRSED